MILNNWYQYQAITFNGNFKSFLFEEYVKNAELGILVELSQRDRI